jgi:hypothetical protein
MFNKFKAAKPFDENIFMGKLIKWTILTDQAFSTVDNEEFEDLLEYTKKDVYVKSRRTLMRRLEELFTLMQDALRVICGLRLINFLSLEWRVIGLITIMFIKNV